MGGNLSRDLRDRRPGRQEPVRADVCTAFGDPPADVHPSHLADLPVVQSQEAVLDGQHGVAAIQSQPHGGPHHVVHAGRRPPDELRLGVGCLDEQLFHRRVTEHGGQVPVVGARRPAALQVPEDGDPGVLTELVLEHLLDLIDGDRRPVAVLRSLGHHHHALPSAALATGRIAEHICSAQSALSGGRSGMSSQFVAVASPAIRAR